MRDAWTTNVWPRSFVKKILSPTATGDEANPSRMASPIRSSSIRVDASDRTINIPFGIALYCDCRMSGRLNGVPSRPNTEVFYEN